MATIQHADLFFQEGSSNKVYHLQLMSYGDGHAVNFQYGRRGGSLNEGTKISGATLQSATKVYNNILNQKLAKGYDISSTSGVDTRYTGPTYATATVPQTRQTDRPARPSSGFSTLQRRVVDWNDEVSNEPSVEMSPTTRDVIFVPQLLNVIEEEDIETYLNDDRFYMQEKIDGNHQAFHKTAGEVMVTNKKGLSIGFPESLKSAIQTEKDLLVDAEIIGDKFYAFDILEANGDDLRNLGYGKRYEVLKTLFSLSAFNASNIVLVPLAVGTRAKKALYKRLKEWGREGVVFKRLDAPYRPGKAHEDMWKFKFYSDVSCRVKAGREGKRSIGLELLKNGKWESVGNVTIGSPKIPLPTPGQIVDVKYLYAYKGGSLYQPVFKGVRNDVDENECIIAQLKYKPEE
jgi:bifunctional non-homologous end joining protein LigD